MSGNRLLCRSPDTVFESPLDEVSYVKGVDREPSPLPLLGGGVLFVVSVALFIVGISVSEGGFLNPLFQEVSVLTGYGLELGLFVLLAGSLLFAWAVSLHFEGRRRYVEVGGSEGVLAQVPVSEELEDSGLYGLLSVMENRPMLEPQPPEVRVDSSLELLPGEFIDALRELQGIQALDEAGSGADEGGVEVGDEDSGGGGENEGGGKGKGKVEEESDEGPGEGGSSA